MHRGTSFTAAIVAIAASMATLGVALGTTAADGDRTPTLVPATPEPGPNGPRIVQPWSGTQLNLGEGWTAEVLQPAPDLDAATPGRTWEALRVTSPLGQRTCSLYVAVAEDGQPSLDRVSPRIKARDIAEPRWDLSAKRPTLLYPDPAQRLAPAEAWTNDDWDADTKSCHPGRGHEVLQVWACAEAVDTEEAGGYGPYGMARVIVRGPEPGETWGTTESAGELLQPRSGYTATLLPDGRVLLVGGGYDGSLASAEVWDPEDRTFAPAGQMKHRRMNHTAVLQPDGGVLIVGGTGRFGQNLKNAELWDPTTSTFTSVPGLRVSRRNSASVLGFPNGRALVFGGTTSSDGRRAWLAEIWDPATGAFEPAGRLPGARNESRAFALPDGDAIVTGPGHKEWLRWDAARRTFEPIGQTSERRDETFQLAGGRLLAVGVNDEATCKKGTAYASTPDAEVWPPGQGAFRTAGAFRAPRYEATVIPLPDGGALFYGGGIATCMDVSRYPSAELWDADARAFRRAGRTELPHWDEATALLPDGRVAVIGGIGAEDYSCGEAVLGSIELWDPATRTFSVAGALDHPRSMATAITLDDGSVLILGGADRMGDPVAAAEIWTPPEAG